MRFWQFVIEGERQLRRFNLQQSHKLLNIKTLLHAATVSNTQAYKDSVNNNTSCDENITLRHLQLTAIKTFQIYYNNAPKFTSRHRYKSQILGQTAINWYAPICTSMHKNAIKLKKSFYFKQNVSRLVGNSMH
jgi:hypothetical protein